MSAPSWRFRSRGKLAQAGQVMLFEDMGAEGLCLESEAREEVTTEEVLDEEIEPDAEGQVAGVVLVRTGGMTW